MVSPFYSCPATPPPNRPPSPGSKATKKIPTIGEENFEPDLDGNPPGHDPYAGKSSYKSNKISTQQKSKVKLVREESSQSVSHAQVVKTSVKVTSETLVQKTLNESAKISSVSTPPVQRIVGQDDINLYDAEDVSSPEKDTSSQGMEKKNLTPISVASPAPKKRNDLESTKSFSSTTKPPSVSNLPNEPALRRESLSLAGLNTADVEADITSSPVARDLVASHVLQSSKVPNLAKTSSTTSEESSPEPPSRAERVQRKIRMINVNCLNDNYGNIKSGHFSLPKTTGKPTAICNEVKIKQPIAQKINQSINENYWRYDADKIDENRFVKELLKLAREVTAAFDTSPQGVSVSLRDFLSFAMKAYPDYDPNVKDKAKVVEEKITAKQRSAIYSINNFGGCSTPMFFRECVLNSTKMTMALTPSYYFRLLRIAKEDGIPLRFAFQAYLMLLTEYSFRENKYSEIREALKEFTRVDSF